MNSPAQPSSAYTQTLISIEKIIGEQIQAAHKRAHEKHRGPGVPNTNYSNYGVTFTDDDEQVLSFVNWQLQSCEDPLGVTISFESG